MALTELRRFAQRFGAAALVDQDSSAYHDAGIAYLRLDEDELLDRVHADQRLLRLPVVRAGDRLSVGLAESEWRGWLS